MASSTTDTIGSKKFSTKHPDNTPVSPKILAALKPVADANNGRISCAQAHQIAAELGVSPIEVGVQMDLQEYRIVDCSMGIFGVKHLKLEPMHEVPPELKNAILSATTDGKVSCAALWKIAAAQGLPKSDLVKAADALKVKITPCQLGAF